MTSADELRIPLAELHWSPLRSILATPSRYLEGVPEDRDHPINVAVLKELWRALEAGEIRHQLNAGRALLPLQLPLSAWLARAPDGRLIISEEGWNFVDRKSNSGVLELEGPRVIEFCEEDARSHFHTRRQQQEQAPAQQPKAVTAAATVAKRTKKLSSLRTVAEIEPWYRDHLADIGVDPDAGPTVKATGWRADRKALLEVLHADRPNGWSKALQNAREAVWGDRVPRSKSHWHRRT